MCVFMCTDICPYRVTENTKFRQTEVSLAMRLAQLAACLLLKRRKHHFLYHLWYNCWPTSPWKACETLVNSLLPFRRALTDLHGDFAEERKNFYCSTNLREVSLFCSLNCILGDVVAQDDTGVGSVHHTEPLLLDERQVRCAITLHG